MSGNMQEAVERLRKALYQNLSDEQVAMIALAEILILLQGSPSLIQELTVRVRGEE